jgi:hypothetical protein
MMLTEAAIREIQEDLELRRMNMIEADGQGVGDTGDAGDAGSGGADKSGASSSIVADSIKALADEDFSEQKDFFKLSQIIKGLAAASEKDQVAKDFLVKLAVSVKKLAGGGDSSNPYDDNKTEPNSDEPLVNHPDRQTTPAEALDVLNAVAEDILGISFYEESDAVSSIAKIILMGKATIPTEFGNKTAAGIADMVKREGPEKTADLILMGKSNLKTGWGTKTRDGLVAMLKDFMSEWVEDDIMGLADVLSLMVERSMAVDSTITGRDWQELRGFADFINKDAARVAKAVSGKDPADILDKARAMVNDVEILIKRMVGIYPGVQRAADLLDKAGRMMNNA